MVKFFQPQPKIDPLPTGIDLTGKTAVITGASAGLGLEVTKQLLRLRLSTAILAVRNVSKGEACIESLLQDRGIQTDNPKPTIKVMELDMDRYDSVQQFAKTLREEVPVVDILILNAGVASLNFERSPSGHERVTQVNYCSNVLLVAELLPHLEAGAEQTGSSARISWVGSRSHESPSFEKKAPIEADEGVLEHIDKKEAFAPFQRYSDTKLLCVLFMYSLAPRLDPKKVIINMMCPGMVNTGMSNMLPLHLRLIINVIKAIRARPVEVGGWVILNAALVAGPESHGKFLADKVITDKPAIVTSPMGQEIQTKLWEETVTELSKLTTLPPQFH
ncbi:short-chain dehydrogenase/reductase family protein [Aspergillus vadensis CBS 113365]|uniref:Short-chain dehydrogenase/reductase family protein n=1 Tax=Aspergillus vadensis (strain CBS 113365 / IMI 142717 / IBT 24658) TaxID=1448311 RepID=A0A319B2W7_ASPVC|nr:short-chain dehydrogenase/reductase family protein [Aspergillus vadensis CBS 113365]PYH64560.1 short-chain dehydrogenase/reductase family protein [Aspergillus vadensis CBS 113365]